MIDNEIILFENQCIKLEVNFKDENVWLNANQIAELFDRDVKTIRKHINNAKKEELKDLVVDAKFATTSKHGSIKGKTQTHLIDYYNLDVIISVGYRVKSKNGIIFRKWANNVLKQYLIKGYAVNQKRMEYLEKTVKIIDIATRMNKRLNGDDAKDVSSSLVEESSVDQPEGVKLPEGTTDKKESDESNPEVKTDDLTDTKHTDKDVKGKTNEELKEEFTHYYNIIAEETHLTNKKDIINEAIKYSDFMSKECALLFKSLAKDGE
jgi:prophage antirepressor-like protein